MRSVVVSGACVCCVRQDTLLWLFSFSFRYYIPLLAAHNSTCPRVNSSQLAMCALYSNNTHTDTHTYYLDVPSGAGATTGVVTVTSDRAPWITRSFLVRRFILFVVFIKNSYSWAVFLLQSLIIELAPVLCSFKSYITFIINFL